MDQPGRLYRCSLRIGEEDTDALGHVNNIVYLRWVQEAAEAHWNELASAQIRENWFWVVLRHEIDYFRPVLPGERLIARTRVLNALGPRSDRLVEICREDESVIFASAKTTWCLMSRSTGRPVRIGNELRQLFGLSQPAS